MMWVRREGREGREGRWAHTVFSASHCLSESRSEAPDIVSFFFFCVGCPSAGVVVYTVVGYTVGLFWENVNRLVDGWLTGRLR